MKRPRRVRVPSWPLSTAVSLIEPLGVGNPRDPADDRTGAGGPIPAEGGTHALIRRPTAEREGTVAVGWLGVASLVLVAVLLAGCGRSANGRSGSSEPPWGLDGVTLPSDEAAVTRVIAAMPDTVAGQERVDRSPYEAEYEQMKLRAVRLGGQSQEDGFPGTVRGYLEQLVDSGELDLQTQRLEPKDDLVYLTATTSANDETVYVMAWGEPDSEWLFSLSADSMEGRLALVAAFVDAATSAA
jgi:hypothetical protein